MIGGLLLVVAALALSAKRSRASLVELARLMRPCVALLLDITRDPTVPRRNKIAPMLVVAYLAMPIDLIPDLIPVLGHLDDALIVAWAIRRLVATAGRERVAGHWQGDPAALERVLRLAAGVK